MLYQVPSFDDVGPIRRFFVGVSYPFKGIRVVATHTSTWRFLVIPIGITAAVFVGAMYVAWQAVGHVMGLIWVPGPQHHWLLHSVWLAISLLVRAGMFLVVGIGMYFTAGLVAIPFNDRLSEKVETLCFGPYEDKASWPTLVGDVVNSVLHTSLSVTLWVSTMVMLFALQLIPGVGQLLYLVLASLVTSMFLAREMMDGCLSRRRMGYRHKLRVVRGNFWVCFGFGAVASCMLWLPALNFVLMPMIVSGGTLLYCHLEVAGRVPEASGTGAFVPERGRMGTGTDPDADEVPDVVPYPAPDPGSA